MASFVQALNQKRWKTEAELFDSEAAYVEIAPASVLPINTLRCSPRTDFISRLWIAIDITWIEVCGPRRY